MIIAVKIVGTHGEVKRNMNIVQSARAKILMKRQSWFYENRKSMGDAESKYIFN